jgi:hypothetical protein
MATITNRDLVQSGSAIFDNTGSYAFKGAFANREVSTEFIVGSLQEGAPKTLIVSDLLGAGKTFLIEKIRQSYGEHPGTQPVDITSADFYRKIKDKLEVKDKTGKLTPFIVIDEVDNKSDLDDLRNALTELSDLRVSERVPIIVLGDYTLRSGRLDEFVGIGEGKLVPMEQLTREFFVLSVSMRVKSVLNRADGDEELGSIFEDDFLRRLVPDLEKPCATFRQTLQLLRELIPLLPGTTDAACFSLPLFGKYWKDRVVPHLSERPRTAYVRLRNFVAEIQGGDPSRETLQLQPVSSIELADIMGMKDMDIDDFIDLYLVPLVRKGLLRYLGNPFEKGEDENARYPEPYLPMPVVLLDAALPKES